MFAHSLTKLAIFTSLASCMVGCGTNTLTPQQLTSDTTSQNDNGTHLTIAQPTVKNWRLAYRQPVSVFSGEPLSHAFGVINESGTELNLNPDNDIQSSCGCTVGRVTNSRWLPGAENLFTVSIQTQDKSGAVAETATLLWRTADGQRRPLKLTLEGDVLPAIQADPRAIVFTKQDSKGPQTHQQVTLSSELNVDWSTLEAHCSSRCFRIRRQVPKTDHVGVLDVTLLENSADGAESQGRDDLGVLNAEVICHVRISSSAERLAGHDFQLTIPISAYFETPFSIKPSALRIKTAKSGDAVACKFMVEGKLVRRMLEEGFVLGAANKTVDDFTFVRTGAEQMFITAKLSDDHFNGKSSRIRIEVGKPPEVFGELNVVRSN